MLPVDQAIYDFRTRLFEDPYYYTTGDIVTANVTLSKVVYDNDQSTIDILSDEAFDTPTLSAYNTTTRALIIAGLSGNETRTLTVFYDIDSLGASDAINNFLDIVPYIWMLLIVLLPAAGIFAIFTGRAT